MQAEINAVHKSKQNKRIGSTLSALSVIFLLIIMLTGAKDAAVYVKNAFSVCIKSVIPSVFPMMVISGMLISGWGGEMIAQIFGSFVSHIFGVSRGAAPAVILGFICGFPIGAASAAKLYEKGIISKEELTHLLTFVNNPGAAFVIFSVGGSMLGSVRLGVMIYLSVIISATISGLLFGRVMGVKPTPIRKSPTCTASLSEIVVSSVSSATTGALNVCAFAAFFSALVGVISGLLERAGASFQLRAAIFGFFELIGGVSILTKSGSETFAALSSAAVCSWSGVSVLMQIAAVCRLSIGKEKLSLSPMILSKSLQATLSPLFLLLLIKITRFDI